LGEQVPIGREIRFGCFDQTEVLAAIQQERRVSPREARNQELQDGIPAVGLDLKGFLNRDPQPDQGVVLQEAQDPDKLPNPGPFFFLLSLETASKRVKAFGQVQAYEGPGIIQRTRLSLQERQIMAVVEKGSFSPPGSAVLCHHLVLAA
jgi:hypothetical protein